MKEIPSSIAIEKMRDIIHWLDFNDENFNYGIRSITDAEKLYNYAIEHSDLNELCDTWDNKDVIKAIGYDPWKES